MKTSRTFGWVSAAMLSAAVAGVGTMGWAQENPAGNAPAGQQDQANQHQDRRGDRMEQFRKRMQDRLKEQLGMSDEEFKAIEPKLDKVMQLRRELSPRPGMMGERRGRGGPGGESGAGGPGGSQANAPASALRTARDDLRKTLDNKDASGDEIKAKLTALRDAEAKTQGELDKAHEQLKEVLTQRQEAVLVMAGMLR